MLLLQFFLFQYLPADPTLRIFTPRRSSGAISQGFSHQTRFSSRILIPWSRPCCRRRHCCRHRHDPSPRGVNHKPAVSQLIHVQFHTVNTLGIKKTSRGSHQRPVPGNFNSTNFMQAWKYMKVYAAVNRV